MVVNILMNAILSSEEIPFFTRLLDNDMATRNETTNNAEHKANLKNLNNSNSNPSHFHLRSIYKKVGFGNSPYCVTPIVYEVKYHSNYGTLLKVFLTRTFIFGTTSSSNSDIPFIPYGFINVSNFNTVKH